MRRSLVALTAALVVAGASSPVSAGGQGRAYVEPGGIGVAAPATTAAQCVVYGRPQRVVLKPSKTPPGTGFTMPAPVYQNQNNMPLGYSLPLPDSSYQNPFSMIPDPDFVIYSVDAATLKGNYGGSLIIDSAGNRYISGGAGTGTSTPKKTELGASYLEGYIEGNNKDVRSFLLGTGSQATISYFWFTLGIIKSSDGRRAYLEGFSTQKYGGSASVSITEQISAPPIPAFPSLRYLVYKAGTGEVNLDQKGSNTYAAAWRPGWTSFMPFDHGNDTYYLAQRAETGDQIIEKINGNGTGVTTVRTLPPLFGEHCFVPFVLDGDNHYLSYEKGTGKAAISRIESNTETRELWSGRWTMGWTSFMPFRMDGQSYILMYKAETGDVAIDRIASNGKGTFEVWSGHWTTGWTSLVPFVINGEPHFLGYKSGTGNVTIDRINAGGRGSTPVWTSTWTTGWTAFMPFDVAGEPHYLAYKAGTGEVKVDRIRHGGLGVTTAWNQSWSKGWTSFFSH